MYMYYSGRFFPKHGRPGNFHLQLMPVSAVPQQLRGGEWTVTSQVGKEEDIGKGPGSNCPIPQLHVLMYLAAVD